MSWSLVAVDKNTGEVVARHTNLHGCFSALKYDGPRRFIERHRGCTLFAEYVNIAWNQSMASFLRSDENHLPIKPGIHFCTRADRGQVPSEGVWINISDPNYRHAMFTKFLLINSSCAFGQSTVSTDAYASAGLPPAMATIATMTVFFYRDSWQATARYWSDDSFIGVKSQLTLLAALMSPNLGLARELSVGSDTLVDFVTSGRSWKTSTDRLNLMYSGSPFQVDSYSSIVPCQAGGDASVFIDKWMRGTRNLSGAQLRPENDQYMALVNAVANFAATCYRKRTTKPSKWWNECVTKKFPFMAKEF